VREIDLQKVSSSHLENLSAAMLVPFPELTVLRLGSYGEVVLPDSFLGGSASHLEELYLSRIPFPGLPKLLLSATHLCLEPVTLTAYTRRPDRSCRHPVSHA
jgi:hypothetical protein